MSYTEPSHNLQFIRQFVDSVAVHPFYDDLLRLRKSAMSQFPPDDPNEARMPVLKLVPLAA